MSAALGSGSRLCSVSALLVAAIAALAFSASAEAATFTVDTTLDGSDRTPDGDCAATHSTDPDAIGRCTLRAAMNELDYDDLGDDMDTINLPAGTYLLTETDHSSGNEFAGSVDRCVPGSPAAPTTT